MKKEQLKNWIGVILAAVVLGLAVSFLIRWWQPQDVTHWLMWGVGALIAVRSVLRIATLAKQIGTKETKDKE